MKVALAKRQTVGRIPLNGARPRRWSGRKQAFLPTAIQNAGIDGNEATLADGEWLSRITNPNYPSHSSGIAGIAGNAEAVLSSFFGNTNNFCIVASATQQQCYGSFSAAATAAADARVHGGIHFRFETDAGLLQGRSIAGFTLSNALAPVPEPQTWAMLILGFGMIGAGMRSRRRPSPSYLTA